MIDSAIDGDVKNEDANYDERFWEVLSTEQGTDSGNVIAETTPNPFGTPRFTSGMEMRNVTGLSAKKVSQPNEKEVVNEFTGELAPNESTQLEKRVIVVTSRDYDTQDALTAAMHQLSDKVAGQSYDELLDAHEKFGQIVGTNQILSLMAIPKPNREFDSIYLSSSPLTMVKIHD